MNKLYRIYCKNQTEWDLVQNILIKLGYQWNSGGFHCEQKRHYESISAWDNKTMKYGYKNESDLTFNEFITKIEEQL